MKLLFERNINATVAAFEKDGKYFCGNCAKEVKKGDQICPRCKSGIIYNQWRRSHKVSYDTRITVSEKDDKILINIFGGKTSLVNGKFYFQKYIHPFVFNFKTGQSYKLPILNGETKKPLRIKGNGIKNISYSTYEMPEAIIDIGDEIKNIFISKACQYNKYIDEIDRLKNSKGDCVANFILSIVKFGYCDEATEKLVNSHYIENELKPTRKYWLKPGAKEGIQKELGIHYSLDAWRLFKNDFSLFLSVYKIGHLKPDNQRKLINGITSISNIRYSLEDSCSRGYGNQISMDYINSLVDLIRLSDNENEMVKRVCKIMLSNPYISEWFIIDAVDMLKKAMNGNVDIKRILKMRTFDAMHDESMKVYRKMKQVNRKIKISPKEEALNSYNSNFNFTVCSETDQLVVIGDAMHICVGSYGDKAVNKDCLIVKGEVNGNLFTCIEIRNKRLIQVKGYCNKLLEGEERKAVIKWAKEKGLEYKDCFDLKRPAKRILDFTQEIRLEIEEPEIEEPGTERLDGDTWLPF